jgi:hypothetical protein
MGISMTAEDTKSAARQRLGFTRELEQPRTVQYNIESGLTRGYGSMSD